MRGEYQVKLRKLYLSIIASAGLFAAILPAAPVYAEDHTGMIANTTEFDTFYESASVLSGTPEEKIASLKEQFPSGRYWNHSASLSSYSLESTTDQPCQDHTGFNGKPYSCNYFDNGYQCAGFAFLCYYKFHGFNCHNRATQSRWVDGNQDIEVGDVVHTGKHWMFVEKINEEWMSVLECNNHNKCSIEHGRVVHISEVKGYYTPKQRKSAVMKSVYRLYNKATGQHLYTQNQSERNSLLTQSCWKDEGIGWYSPLTSSRPVYRLGNPNTEERHYTMDQEERKALIEHGWKDEGICWYSTESDTSCLYRLYNPNAETGNHHYTKSVKERDALVAQGWKDEGLAWSVLE